MTGYRCVVFDLDGTLVESSADIARALNAALGGSQLSSADVSPLLGEGVDSLVSSAAALAGLGTDGDLDAIRQRYLTEYRAHPVVDSTLYPGVAQTLAALTEAGVPMGVCTNKSEAIARQVLTGLGVSRHFPVILGADRVEHPKPHPAHLLTTLTELGGDASTSIFIGDSTVDQACGLAAKVDFRAVPWAAPPVTCRLRAITELPAIVAGRPTTTADRTP